MKRGVSLLLAAILLLSFCGCGVQEPATTESSTLPVNIMQKEDPEGDGSMNVFFVSNSTCCYFPDELHGMLAAAGYEKVKLAVAYYSGCTIKQHNEWLKVNERAYSVRVWDENGMQVMENCSLKDALGLYNWDMITFDNSASTFRDGDTQKALDLTEPHFSELFGYIKEQFPLSRFAWHEVWANEIGYSLAFKMETVEQRTKVYEAKHGVMKAMMEKYGIEGIPTGDAWEKVRDLPLFTTPIAAMGAGRFALTSRIENGKFKDDYTHDGDIGGGQYLNACVFFEILTGKSCIGNTFRPKYELNRMDCSLTEEKIEILQNAAHEAVLALSK